MAKKKTPAYSVEERDIPLSDIVLNSGQIDGLAANPRFIRDEKFEALKRSLQDDPEMLNLRELIVFPHEDKFVIIGGNMRYRAAKELGITSLPCKVLSADTPVEKLGAIIIKDNVEYGQWNNDMLSDEWNVEDLQEWGLDLPFSVNDADIDDFFEDYDKERETKDRVSRLVVCPYCGKEHEI